MPSEPPNYVDPPPALTDALFLRIFQAQLITIGRAWHHDRVLSPFWRLYVNDREGARVVWEGGDYELKPGIVHLIPSGVMFDCRCNRRVRHFYVHFDLVGLPLPALRGVFDRPIGLKPDRALRSLIDALLAGWGSGGGGEKGGEKGSGPFISKKGKDEIKGPDPFSPLGRAARVKAVTYQALGVAIERLSQPGHEQLRRWTDGRDAITPAVRYIEEHLGQPISNAMLARMCHMSPDHFIRRFRQFTGRPPAKYIMDRRVNHASQRLLLTDESIDRIAEASGFPDRFYFSRVFRQRTLISPAAYRKWARV